jgi:glycogen debranching enzyme
MLELYPQVRLRVREDMVFATRGDTVLSCKRDGSIEGSAEQGLFVHQTRLLSRHRIQLAGRTPLLAASSNSRQDRWDGYLIVPPPGDDGEEASLPQRASQEALELAISRVVGEGMHEDLDVTNFTRKPIRTTLVIELDADFADPEETKGKRKQKGTVTRTWTKEDGVAHVLHIDYSMRRRYAHGVERGSVTLRRATRIRVQHASSPPRRQGRKLVFDIDLPPRGHWHACIEYVADIDGEALSAPDCMLRSGSAESDRTHAPYLEEATSFHSAESETLASEVVATLEQARHDIAALRLFRLDRGPRAWTVAAGVPMYIGLFGRDALIASWEAGFAGPELLRGTLPLLADLQGTRNLPWRDEQPGRILHEAHEGPLAKLYMSPKGRYYGSVSSSALFPFCVAQLWSWTGDREAVAPLVEPAMRALGWLDKVCLPQGGRGFYAYKTRSRDGLDNQSWKDSSDAIVDEDGKQVKQPVATCEEQGAVFTAKVAMADVLDAFGHPREAKRLFAEATELKKRFNDAYWIEDADFFAMALDPKGRQVRTIGSNALHCLSAGIADEALVPRVLQRLFEADMFSGWGIRTLSSAHPAYNPYAYHRGTVWPVEHGPFAIGAYRAGARDRVDTVTRAMFEVAALFDSHRLPECFSGHARDPAHPFPSLYPPANSPQAWSATTAFALVQAMLGLQPYAPHGLLLVDPHLPDWLPTLRVCGLRVGDAVLDIRFTREADGETRFHVERQRGELRVVQRPSPWSLALQFGDSLKQLLAA